MIAVPLAILAFIVVTALTAEYPWWGQHAARGAIRMAVVVQRRPNRARYREEWLAELGALMREQGHPGLLWALWTLSTAPVVRRHARIAQRSSSAAGNAVDTQRELYIIEGHVYQVDFGEATSDALAEQDEAVLLRVFSEGGLAQDTTIVLPSGRRVRAYRDRSLEVEVPRAPLIAAESVWRRR